MEGIKTGKMSQAQRVDSKGRIKDLSEARSNIQMIKGDFFGMLSATQTADRKVKLQSSSLNKTVDHAGLMPIMVDSFISSEAQAVAADYYQSIIDKWYSAAGFDSINLTGADVADYIDKCARLFAAVMALWRCQTGRQVRNNKSQVVGSLWSVTPAYKFNFDELVKYAAYYAVTPEIEDPEIQFAAFSNTDTTYDPGNGIRTIHWDQTYSNAAWTRKIAEWFGKVIIPKTLADKIYAKFSVIFRSSDVPTDAYFAFFPDLSAYNDAEEYPTIEDSFAGSYIDVLSQEISNIIVAKPGIRNICQLLGYMNPAVFFDFTRKVTADQVIIVDSDNTFMNYLRNAPLDPVARKLFSDEKAIRENADQAYSLDSTNLSMFDETREVTIDVNDIYDIANAREGAYAMQIYTPGFVYMLNDEEVGVASRLHMVPCVRPNLRTFFHHAADLFTDLNVEEAQAAYNNMSDFVSYWEYAMGIGAKFIGSDNIFRCYIGFEQRKYSNTDDSVSFNWIIDTTEASGRYKYLQLYAQESGGVFILPKYAQQALVLYGELDILSNGHDFQTEMTKYYNAISDKAYSGQG